MTTRRALGVLGCLLLAVPVMATFREPGVPLSLQLGSAVILVLALVRPVWGLYALSAVLPLSTYIWVLSGQPFESGAAVAEMSLAPFLLAASVRFVISPRRVESWLARPAVFLGCVVAADTALALVAQQHSTSWPSVFLLGLWHHVQNNYYGDPAAFLALHTAVPWLEGLALSVVVERLVRTDPRAGPWVTRVLLVGSSAGALLAVNHLIEISRRHPPALRAAIGFLFGSAAQRISPLYGDVNAAGSLGALFFVAASWLTFKDRRPVSWITAILLAFALWVTHSRAAVSAAAVSLAAMWLIRQRLSRTWAIAIATVATVLLIGLALWSPSSRAQSSSGDSMQVRVRMTAIGMQVFRGHPLFGVGLGQFKRASQAFITPEFIALFPQAAKGENAHNNFVQLLAELGLAGLVGFVWLVAAPSRAIARAVSNRAASEPLIALAGGVVAFLATCLLGHPLLTDGVLWLFLLVVGVTAGLAPARPAASSRWTARMVSFMVIFVFLSAPVRLWQLQRQSDLNHVVIGATAVVGTQDDIDYRLADRRSVWFVTAKARAIEIPLRLTSDSRPPCLVHFEIDGRSANTIAPLQSAWVPVTFEFQPTSRDPLSRRIDIQVDGASCRLMVGAFKFRG